MTWWAWMLAGIGALSIFLLLVTLPFFLVFAVQVFKTEKTREKKPQDEPAGSTEALPLQEEKLEIGNN